MSIREVLCDIEPDDDNELKLDTTGEYLSVGHKKPCKQVKSAEERGLEEFEGDTTSICHGRTSRRRYCHSRNQWHICLHKSTSGV